MSDLKPSYKDLEERIKELERKSDYFQLIADHGYDLEIFRDTSGKVQYCNKAFETITGYPAEDFIKGEITEKDIVLPDDWERVLAQMAQTTMLIVPEVDIEFRILAKDKKIKTVSLCSLPVYRDGKHIGFRTSIRDVTHSANIKQLLRNKENAEQIEGLYHSIIQTAFDGYMIIDLATNILEVNEAYCKMLGYDKNEFIRMRITDIESLETKEETFTHAQKVIEQGSDLFQTKQRCKDGSEKDVEISVVYNPIMDGVLIFFAKDITEQKKYERDLLIAKEKAEENEQKFKIYAAQSPVAIYVTDKTGNCIYANDNWLRIAGMELDEAFGSGWINALHPEDKESISEKWYKSVQSKGNWEFEYRFVNKKNGKITWVRGTAKELFSNNNELIGYLGSNIDITDRKKAEIEFLKAKEKAEENEQKFKVIATSTPDHLLVMNTELRYTFVLNPQLGLTADDMIGKTDFDLLEKNDAENLTKLKKKVIETGEPEHIEIPLVSKDGSFQFFDGTYIPKYNEQGKIDGLIGYFRNVTQQKQAEIAIGENMARLKTITENSPDTILQVNKEGKITFANRIMPGLTEDEVIGSSIYKWVPKEQFDILSKVFENAFEKNKSDEYESLGPGPNNESRLYQVRVKPLEFEGKTLEAIYTATDITERKKAEKELITAKEKAEESDRLKTAFLHNMSHEIRTPMNAIMGFAELMKENFNNKTKLERFSTIIVHRCNDLLDIINDLMDIAKIESGQLQLHLSVCDINTLFAELKESFSQYCIRMGKQEISFNLYNNCPNIDYHIVTDTGKLKQILNNLITNAFKYTEVGSVKGDFSIEDENLLVFKITDTGIGIHNDKQNLIFDRFIRLSHNGKQNIGGTGLGLSIVKGLVHLLGGKVYLESEVGKGSTFTVKIPFKAALIESTDTQVPLYNSDADLSGKTILLVEDDPYNAEYIVEVLETIGVTIELSKSGADAVNKILSQSFDLVLMDIRLPDMNGYDVTKKLKEYNPKLKIIAQTAYAATNEQQKALSAGCDGYISKPLKSESLIQMVMKHITK